MHNGPVVAVIIVIFIVVAAPSVVMRLIGTLIAGARAVW